MKPPHSLPSTEMVQSVFKDSVETKSIPTYAGPGPWNVEEGPPRNDVKKVLRCSLPWTQPRKILATARDAARWALQAMGGDLVPARKPHTKFSCVLTDFEVGHKYGVRFLLCDEHDQERRGVKPRPHPRYLRTVHPRWLIVFPECLRDPRRREPGWRAAFYVERETVWQAADLLEEAWCLHYELNKTTPDLDSVISLSMRIGEICERLSRRHLLVQRSLRLLTHRRRSAHRASVEAKREILEQKQRPWADEMHALRKRLGLMAACSVVARKHKIGIRRMHQIYRKYFPSWHEFSSARATAKVLKASCRGN
jgi:hypothetical protein